MFITIDVLRGAGQDCTLNGVSSCNDVLYMAHPNGNVSLEQIAERGGVIVEVITRNIGSEEYKHLAPVKARGSWTMMGGNYATSSDSRFSDISRYPLAIHDRIEG